MCASFSQYQIDLETFISEVVLPDCPPPVFALAHSMGATILLRAAFAGHRWFDRMVLLAPMIALPGHAPVGRHPHAGQDAAADGARRHRMFPAATPRS